MNRKRTIVVGVLLASSLLLSGCKKKKPPVPPPQAQAPTITDTTAVPAEIPEVPVPQPAAPEPQPSKPSAAIVKKPKPPRPKVETKKTPSPSQPAQPPSDKVIIDEGGKQDPSPPLVADTQNQAAQQRSATNQLLGAAEYNLNNLHRTLSKDDQAIVQHVRGFIEQSRQAMKDGDIERAHTLAIKAHLMSDELVKR